MSREVEKFLDLLERRSLLPERTLAKLYRQMEDKKERGKSVPVDSLAKLLVDKGHLTQRQANSLINEISEVGRSSREEEEYGLAPIDDEPVRRKVKSPPPSEEALLSETEPYAEELTDDEVAALAKPKKKKRKRWVEEETEGGAAASRPAPQQESPLADLPVATELKRRRAQKDRARSEWESPLLLVGGGGLLLLVLVGTLVWYLLRTDTGDAQLRAAREAYQDGAYSQAIETYERFLDTHSDHDSVSAARVQLGLARIRRAMESGATSEVVLTQTQNVIEAIEQEPAFNEAGRELAAILPRIAQGLADEAIDATSPEDARKLSARTEEALALLTNTKYVPKSFRPTETVEDVRRKLASVERRQRRQQALASALTAIAAAREKQNFQEAYRIHTDLVRSYADVADLPEVRRAVAEIASAEARSLRFREEARAASTEEREASEVGSLLLTTAVQAGAGENIATKAFVRIGGAVYGVDAATGEPLWRRHVGHDERLLPLAISDGDVLVVDQENRELLRLEGGTGRLVWRQAVGEAVDNPVVHAGRVLVPTRDAKLLVVEVESGETKGHVQFAQPLATSPAVDAESNRLAVVGERSIVYLLAADTLRGEDAVFVGHSAGSVSVPAVALGDTLCVAENFAESRSRLHVLTLRERDGDAGDGEAAEGETTRAWRAPIEPIRLTGRVTTPMAVRDRRLALATDRGEVRVFDIPAGTEGPPVSPVASRDASADDSHDRYLVLRESDLWVAGTRLLKLRILSTGGRLQSLDIPRTYDGDAFVHPLLDVGERLVHVRRPQGKAGHLLAAISLPSGKPLWEHELASPPTDLSILADPSAIAVSLASGRLFAVPPSSTSRASGRQISSAVVAPQGIAAICQSAGRIVVQGFGEEDRLAWVELDGSVASGAWEVPGGVAAPPVALGEGVVVPLVMGQVFLIDAASGESLAAPFQPLIRPNRLPAWTSASVVDPRRTFAIADRRERVYLLEWQREPARLSLAAQSPDLPQPITGELCATSRAVFAAAGSRLLIYVLPDLAEGESLEFERRIVWGPFHAGEVVVLATADGRLHCLTQEGGKLAEASLAAAAIGRPHVNDDGSVILALEDGTLLRVDAQDGAVATLGTFGEPLAVGPVGLNGTVYAATTDGVLVWQPLAGPATLAAASASP